MTSGDALAHTELFGMVTGSLAALKRPDVFEIVDRIKECYKEVRHQEIRERVLGPRGFENLEQFYRAQNYLNSDVVFRIQAEIDRYDYGLSILLAGATEHGTHIYGVSDPGTSQCYDAIDFHAIGSGAPHALNSLIARGCHATKSLYETIMVVYEAKQVAEKAPGVGILTDMAIVTCEQMVPIPREEIERIKPIYEKWLRHDVSWESDIVGLFETQPNQVESHDESHNDSSGPSE